MKARFESVMLWLLKFYDISSLLPVDYEIQNPQNFVQYVSLNSPVVNSILVKAVADTAATEGRTAIKEGHNALLTSLVSLAVHQAGHVVGVATAKNELEQYAVEQPRGNPADGVPNLAAAG